MKNIILALAILSVTLSAFGQTPGVRTFPNASATWNGGTNNIAATTTNSPTADTISVSEYANVGYQITVKPISTSTGTVVFNFAQSLDSTSYETVPQHTVTCTLNGTGAITTCGNFSIPSAGTLKLATIVNTNAMAITNIAIVYRLKAPRETR